MMCQTPVFFSDLCQVRNYVVIDDVMEVQCLPYGSTDTDKYL